MSDAKVKTFGEPERPWTLAEEDVSRQAVASLRGYVYQLHQSAAAWINLGPDDVLYLEVAEDFAELLREPNQLDDILKATQVKDTRDSGSVTLNSEDVIAAIESLFRLRTSNHGREVQLTFLTTSEIGQERKLQLPSGTAGLVGWRTAAQGGDVEEIRSALLARFESGALRTFVETSSPERLRAEFLAPLTFVCGARDWRTVEENNRQALIELRDEVQSTADMAYRAYDAILSHLSKVLLGSADRRLDRKQLIACLERATTIAVPSQVVSRLQGAPAVAKAARPFTLAELTAAAEALLDAGKPPSVGLLFSDALPAALSALNAIAARERTVVEVKRAGEAPTTATISQLVARPELQHLVVGPPGSGKTHALWQAAHQLIEVGEIVPLYLPAAQLSTWAEMLALVADVTSDHSPAALLSDPRVCVCIDGWSEFAIGKHVGERQKALRALRNVRVLANGKFVDAGDVPFQAWSLELLAPDDVVYIVKQARPGEATPPQPVLDLLRLPLLLSIHALSGAQASAVGELLRQFHDYIARDLPETFTLALAEAVADTSLADDRSFGRFASNLRARAESRGLAEPIKLLQSLGTIVERNGQALPIHDLYWSWLSGRGLLSSEAARFAIGPLRTRECYTLALQSGARASDGDARAVLDDDLILAAALEHSRRPKGFSSTFIRTLEAALDDARLAVRNRGALAALETSDPAYLRRALDVLSELTRSKLHVQDWSQALHPDRLFSQRATIADWLGSDGADFVLDAIAERGGQEWTTWLEQAATAGRITRIDALAAALGCGSDVPGWGDQHSMS